MAVVKRICNGKIVTPDEVIDQGTVVLEGDIIARIERGSGSPAGPHDIDAAGLWILPGLVDTHSDAIEQEIQPRPTSVMPIRGAFYELERKLAGQGITTVFHSLSLYYKENEGEWIRRNENVKAVIDQIHSLTQERSMIRNRIHLRYEMRNVQGFPYVKEFLDTNRIDQLSFMDHTPGKGQWHDVEVQKKKIMQRLNLTSPEAEQYIHQLQQDAGFDIGAMTALSELAFERGIPVASHDDDSVEKLHRLEQWKAAISEFPITLEVAQAAKRRGFRVVMGAPNLLIGGSHNKNLSTLAAIEAGAVDILCSDYYPGSLLQSVFFLHERGFDLADAMRLVTLHPAQALGLDRYIGSIETGKQADLLLVEAANGQPLLHRTLVEGEVVYQARYRRGGAHPGR